MKITNIFQSTFEMPAGLVDTIVEWESKGLSNKKLNLLLQQIIIFLQD